MKRLFDLVATSILFILLSPIFIVVYVLIFFKLGRPIIFRQQRVGRNNKIFEIVKFRSMLPKTSIVQSEADRLTAFGRWLRSTSLDELPELWNVIKGEMSLVGPRPLLVQYLPLYTLRQARRHDVRPGLTGWAQINGRNALTWKQKFELDVWYVENRSLWLDFKILAVTVYKVLKRDGISAAGETTMPYFTGDN